MTYWKSVLLGLIVWGACAAWALPGAAQEAGAPFTFGVLGDSRGAELGGARAALLANLFRHSGETYPDLSFLVFSGDMVNGSPDGETNRAQLEKWQAIADENLTAKLHPVIGNHEAKSPAAQEAYRAFYPDTPQNGPKDELGLTYYVDHGNCRFIMIDTNYVGDTYRVRHMRWLKARLKEARRKDHDHVFVFGHSPAYPVSISHMHDCLSNVGRDPENFNLENLPHRDAFWALLGEYGVTAYICGHEHVYVRQRIKGVWHITSGGGGAPPYPLPPAHPGPNATEEERAPYEAMLPYYKLFGIPHGPGDAPYSGGQAVGLRAFHYMVFEVDGPKVKAKTYGTLRVRNYEDVGAFSLLDEFVMMSNRED